ncbi:hypothetical protein ACXDH6_000001, partial [Klebsiella pneumoniae]
MMVRRICSAGVISDMFYLCAMWGALSKPFDKIASVMLLHLSLPCVQAERFPYGCLLRTIKKVA